MKGAFYGREYRVSYEGWASRTWERPYREGPCKPYRAVKTRRWEDPHVPRKNTSLSTLEMSFRFQDDERGNAWSQRETWFVVELTLVRNNDGENQYGSEGGKKKLIESSGKTGKWGWLLGWRTEMNSKRIRSHFWHLVGTIQWSLFIHFVFYMINSDQLHVLIATCTVLSEALFSRPVLNYTNIWM